MVKGRDNIDRRSFASRLGVSGLINLIQLYMFIKN